ncbi:MAG: hypothetical protein DWI26_06750 [Planctomycetota bacterium]|nr:MAG: hypothetical protein DWI26_06750 [Planctomycetota bacterium]
MRLPGRSALCRARKRLGAEPLRQLHAEVVQAVAILKIARELTRKWAK